MMKNKVLMSFNWEESDRTMQLRSTLPISFGLFLIRAPRVVSRP